MGTNATGTSAGMLVRGHGLYTRAARWLAKRQRPEFGALLQRQGAIPTQSSRGHHQLSPFTVSDNVDSATRWHR
ncbi:MAG: hypothetical protein IPO05_16455 [Flavobacteriales bacterium]|nr:hypothetical protein [Flavobacteriales bacterium]